MHWPFALTPLAAEYVRLIGSGMNDRYEWYGTSRSAGGSRSGTATPTSRCSSTGTPEEFEAVSARWQQCGRTGSTARARGGATRRCPSCATCMRAIAAVDVDGALRRALAAAWTDAWEAGHRAWAIHFVAIMGAVPGRRGPGGPLREGDPGRAEPARP